MSALETPQPEKSRWQTPSGTLKRVTLRDIAERVGVTPVSVSLAMRNSFRVSEPLRRKIQNIANEMGYRPDPMLTALAYYRRANVKTKICAEMAWINCWTKVERLRSHREFDLYWKGAYEEAEKCGYRLEEIPLKNLSFSRLEQILQARNIQGIVLPPLQPGAPQPDWQNFAWDKFCVVRFGYSVKNPRFHVVSSDQLTNGIIACENLQSQGYNRIGLVTGTTTTVRFAAGYLHHQMQSKSISKFMPLKLHEKNRDEDKRMLSAWIKKNKPDAIFTDCAHLPNILVEMGVKIPNDVTVATTSILDGNISTGIYQNSEEIGRAAIQLLISLINHGEFGIPNICREVLVEGNWVSGSPKAK